MSVKTTRSTIYKQCREKLGLNQSEWARLFFLMPKSTPKSEIKGQNNVSNKETGARGVNYPEALAAQLLCLLADEGYDVSQLDFDSDGNVIGIVKDPQ